MQNINRPCVHYDSRSDLFHVTILNDAVSLTSGTNAILDTSYVHGINKNELIHHYQSVSANNKRLIIEDRVRSEFHNSNCYSEGKIIFLDNNALLMNSGATTKNYFIGNDNDHYSVTLCSQVDAVIYCKDQHVAFNAFEDKKSFVFVCDKDYSPWTSPLISLLLKFIDFRQSLINNKLNKFIKL